MVRLGQAPRPDGCGEVVVYLGVVDISSLDLKGRPLITQLGLKLTMQLLILPSTEVTTGMCKLKAWPSGTVRYCRCSLLKANNWLHSSGGFSHSGRSTSRAMIAGFAEKDL